MIIMGKKPGEVTEQELAELRAVRAGRRRVRSSRA